MFTLELSNEQIKNCQGFIVLWNGGEKISNVTFELTLPSNTKTVVRWPGKIKPGSVLNGIVSHIDMFPTLLAAAGDTEVTQKLLKGYKVGDKTFKVHLDGYNMIPYLTGAVKESPRQFILYI